VGLVGHRFSILQTPQGWKARLSTESWRPIQQEPGVVAAFCAMVRDRGYYIIPVYGPQPPYIRMGLLCWSADVAPANRRNHHLPAK
jgi:hypothetical protein